MQRLTLCRRWLLTALAASAAIAGLSGPPATAGTFQLRSCMAARSEHYDSSAFAATRSSTRMMVRRSCDPFGVGERGLTTANRISKRRVRKSEHASAILRAPPGTRVTRLDWSGKLRRGDCNWTVELYAIRPGQKPRFIRRALAGRSCPKKRKANASYAPPKAYALGSATAIVQRVICRRAKGCSARSANALTTRYAKAYIADYTRPSVRITGGGLASGKWVRGLQELRYVAVDNVGIRSARLMEGGVLLAGATRPCNYARPGPCPSGSGLLKADTPSITDGRHALSLEARDASGNASRANTFALIDNSAPRRVSIAITGEGGWRRTNSFSARWSATSERFAPITAALAKLCPAGTGACSTTRYVRSAISSLTGIRVAKPGDWTLVIWRQDAAGNASEAFASEPVHLRFDPDPPRLAFESPTMSDPTRLSVLVREALSGVAAGEIEIRRQGTSAWQALRVTRSGSRLIARIDDAGLPAGLYEMRARARDLAGNEGSTASRADGSRMLLRLPIRFRAVIDAGLRVKRTIRRRGGRRGHRRTRRKRVWRVAPHARLRIGERGSVIGTLRNTDGQPIGGAPLYVYSRTPGLPELLTGVVNTDATGHFTYTVIGSNSRTLRFAYAGTRLALPAEAAVSMLVPASTSIRASRRRARNGQSVLFRGRLRGDMIPHAGKLVEVQAHFRGRWRTFSTVRTDAQGRWRFRYRFGGTVGRVKYRFRALLPVEGGYPFERGKSRTVRVLVRG